MLAVPNLPVFANYSAILVRDDRGALSIWPIATPECVVIALPRSVVAARDGTVGVACMDLRRSHNGWGSLDRLSHGICRERNDIDLLEIIRGSSVDSTASLHDSSWSSGVDCA